MSCIESVPKELLVEIVVYLNAREIVQISPTNRAFWGVSNSQYLWKKLYARIVVGSKIQNVVLVSWKKIYQKLHFFSSSKTHPDFVLTKNGRECSLKPGNPPWQLKSIFLVKRMQKGRIHTVKFKYFCDHKEIEDYLCFGIVSSHKILESTLKHSVRIVNDYPDLDKNCLVSGFNEFSVGFYNYSLSFYKNYVEKKERHKLKAEDKGMKVRNGFVVEMTVDLKRMKLVVKLLTKEKKSLVRRKLVFLRKFFCIQTPCYASISICSHHQKLAIL